MLTSFDVRVLRSFFDSGQKSTVNEDDSMISERQRMDHLERKRRSRSTSFTEFPLSRVSRIGVLVFVELNVGLV